MVEFNVINFATIGVIVALWYALYRSVIMPKLQKAA